MALFGCTGCFGRARTTNSTDDTAAERAKLPRIVCTPRKHQVDEPRSLLAPLSPTSEVETMDLSREVAAARPPPVMHMTR